MGLLQPLGLFALAALIPFIILYLRKPKPKDKVIPSLMFLMKEEGKSQKFHFFQRFAANLLFLLQLFTLTLLAFAIAYPTITLPYDVTRENTVIIIDASASMQAKEGSSTRFEKAVKEAKKHVSGRTTIILAEASPLIVLEEQGTDLAFDVLGKITARATTTNLGDALLLAKDILGGNPGRIVLISDFLITEGPDVQVVKTTITSDDKLVDFIDVAGESENTGIVKMEVGKFSSKVFVKNFDLGQKKRTINIEQGGNVIASSGEIVIDALSVENFEFDTPPGLTTIKITPKDDFKVDDEAYIATPKKVKNNIVLITNEKNSNLELALRSAPDANLLVVNPPVLTITTDGEKISPYEQDIIIMYRVEQDSILPGTFKDIQEYVEKGGSFIFSGQPDISGFNLGKLSLVKISRVSSLPAEVCVDTVNSVTKYFENARCFTTAQRYMEAESLEGSIIFASAGQSPVIAYKEYEGGQLAYYGLLDEFSDFKSLPAYPIFWSSLINFMVGAEDIRDYNFRTGDIVTIDEQAVTTPSGTITTSKLLLDEQGVYEYDGRAVAVNLLSEKESEISAGNHSTALSEREALLNSEERMHEFNLVYMLTLIGFILMFLELVYIKMRGDV